MLPYNTDLESPRLPEFGRLLQNLVDHCVTIEDRDERTACAYSIAETMAVLFPTMAPNHDYSKIWDQINIMSGFKLDIDFPCEVMTAEKLHPVPATLRYETTPIKMRHYGRHIEQMITTVASLEESEEKERLVSMIAHHMKKLMLQHNKEGVDDAKILRDLDFYSEGKIKLDPETYMLHEIREVKSPQQAKRKKRK